MAKRKTPEATPEVPEGTELPNLLSLLRAVYQIHQTAHWQAKGTTSYGDHLLFQRLYEALVPEIDAVAERTIGTSANPSLVEPIAQADDTATYVAEIRHSVKKVANNKDLTYVSLYAEQYVLDMIDEILSQNQSQGTQNLLQGIADTHETHVYLLQQRLSE
jgi:DNA-binding ferritin-like protein